MQRTFVVASVVAILLAVPAIAGAQWQDQGLQIPVAGDNQMPAAISDGAGGLIVAYITGDPGERHVRAQRIDGFGNLLWDAQGVNVCDFEPGDQTYPDLTGDGDGGAYIAWLDTRLPTIITVYAQHVDASGNPSYTENGIPLVTGSGFTCRAPRVEPMAEGCALVTWAIELGTTFQVRIQKLDPNGTEWSYGGVVARATSNYILGSYAVELRDGTIAVVYEEEFAVDSVEVQAVGLHPDATAKWGPRSVSTSPGYDALHDVLADDFGSFWVAGTRTEGINNVWASRLSSTGVAVVSNGILLTSAGGVGDIRLAAAEDGVWVGWSDSRNDPDEAVYVQHVSRDMEPQLATDGRLVCQDNGARNLVDLVADGEGGVLIGWRDGRWGGTDLFVQKFNSVGYGQWVTGGYCLRAQEAYAADATFVSDGSGGLLSAFSDVLDDDTYDLFVQRVERNGYWGYPAAAVSSVRDVPGDQGGRVLLSWDASRLDFWPEADIYYYTLWRSLPTAKAAGVSVSGQWSELVGPDDLTNGLADGLTDGLTDGLIRAEETGTATSYWLLLDTVDAYSLPGYAQIVSTFADSTGSDPADQIFQVIAHGFSTGQYWISPPATGRSVDNTAPSSPQDLAGAASYAVEGMTLSWRPVAAPDLSHYAVFRGASASFVPDVTNLVAVTTDSTCFDGGWDHRTAWHYKVAAVDVHENPSLYAYLAANAASAVGDGNGNGDGVPGLTALQPNRPNPFNPQTSIRYQLAVDGPVTLRVFDAAGRLVRTLVDERQTRGSHEVTWDGRDGDGQRAASGVFLCRLEAGGLTRMTRMTLLK